MDLKFILGLEGFETQKATQRSSRGVSTAPALGSIKDVASLEERDLVVKQPDPLMRSLELGDKLLDEWMFPGFFLGKKSHEKELSWKFEVGDLLKIMGKIKKTTVRGGFKVFFF